MKTRCVFIVTIICMWGAVEVRDLNFGDRISSWTRQVPYVGNVVDDRALQPARRVLDNVRERYQRESNQDHPLYFVKRIESFLGKLVPSKELVQDLMGMPEPDSSISNEISHEVSDVLRNSIKSKVRAGIQTPLRSQYIPQTPPPPLRSSYSSVTVSPFRPPIFRRPLPPQPPAPPSPLPPPPPIRAPTVSSSSARGQSHQITSNMIDQEEEPNNISKIPILLHKFAQGWFEGSD